jgi:FkbM family methyltransferase
MNRLLRVLRRLARLPGLRRVMRVPFAQRAGMALRFYLIEERTRFIGNELIARPTTGRYHLRPAGIAICLRHHSPDIYTLDEIFAQRVYDFPASVLNALSIVRERPLEVLDLGGNIGLFGAYVLAYFGDARITALEPDPSNAKIHRCCIEANGREETWKLFESYASTADGQVTFVAGNFALSHGAVKGEKGALPVEARDVFPHMEKVDLLKIDIEGSEWPILADERFPGVAARALALEYHPRMCPSDDPESEARRLLERAGFSVQQVFRRDGGEGMLWAWRA